MFHILRIVAVLILIASTIITAKVIPSSNDGRIVGGKPAYEGQFPYQVSIQNNGKHWCGGTIYNDWFIITAAHCIDGLPPTFINVTVVTGSTRLSTGGTSYRATHSVSQGYEPGSLRNDIAVMGVDRQFEFNDYVQPIPITTRYVGETNGVASGWGDTSATGPNTDVLQYVELMTVTNKYCQEQHGSDLIHNTNICTYTKKGEGMCHGDSGSPLVVDGEITGIVSWGRPCAEGYPDVYTRVYCFEEFIRDHTTNEIPELKIKKQLVVSSKNNPCNS